MAQPPASPQSSDIDGVQRDEQKIVAERKASTSPQEETFLGARAQDAARPPYDPDIASKGNSR